MTQREVRGKTLQLHNLRSLPASLCGVVSLKVGEIKLYNYNSKWDTHKLYYQIINSTQHHDGFPAAK